MALKKVLVYLQGYMSAASLPPAYLLHHSLSLRKSTQIRLFLRNLRAHDLLMYCLQSDESCKLTSLFWYQTVC